MKKIFHILFISLFIFSCDNDSDSVTNEIDVDWFLIRTENMNNDEVVGYYFYYKNSLMNFDGNNNFIEELNMTIPEFINLDGEGLSDIYIKFSYNEEEFNFNVSDVDINSNHMGPSYLYTNGEGVERIIYNEEMDYFLITLNNVGSGSLVVNSLSPNELIDYR